MAQQRSIFDEQGDSFKQRHAPLAFRIRARDLDEFVGQEDLLSPGKILNTIITTDQIPSMLFWGPSGSGKTTLARIIAARTGSTFISFSAVISGIKEIKEVIEQARRDIEYYGKRTILFIDEIHRFNKAQQDAFLPHIEDGTIIFIGATTENPSFQVNTPLLSRVRVFVLKQLSIENLMTLCTRALENGEQGLLNLKPRIDDDVLRLICSIADGDARSALNTLELSVLATKPDKDGYRTVHRETLAELLQRQTLQYDHADEEHYNLISALHKALRGSDPQGAIYWLMRMLKSGEDPLFIARRMIRFASEDVGLADSQALLVAIAARDTYHFLGMPEGALALVHAAVYLATAPKSNALYMAEKRTAREIEETGSLPVPLHIRNAPTDLMKTIGYGKDYQYAHDLPDAIDFQDYLPEGIKEKSLYRPTEFGQEKEIKGRMAARDEYRRKNRKLDDTSK